MKSLFPEFYSPNEAEIQQLWANALFVLDTNVLLNAYRLPDQTRDQFLSLLGKLKTRLWLPHQVGLEFQRNRTTVIVARKKELDEIQSNFAKSISLLNIELDKAELDKHSTDVNIDSLLKSFKDCLQKIEGAPSLIVKNSNKVSHDDPIRDKLDKVFLGRVGDSPKSQEDLDALFKEGAKRYEQKIPPGYKDADKSKEGGSGSYISNGLMYDPAFGDLIIWRQIIDHAKRSKAKSLIFVTADNKEDWWHRVAGSTLGPRPELIDEIRRDADVSHFWMYSFERFGEFANKYLNADLSDQSLRDISKAEASYRNLRSKNLLRSNYETNFVSNMDYKHKIRGGISDYMLHNIRARFESSSEQILLELDGSSALLKLVDLDDFRDTSISKLLFEIVSKSVRDPSMAELDEFRFFISVKDEVSIASMAEHIFLQVRDISDFIGSREKIKLIVGRIIQDVFIPYFVIINLAVLKRL